MEDPQRIENLIDRTPALCLLADVANRLKHSELHRRSRSDTVPHLGRPGYSIDSRRLKSLEISTGGGVVIDPVVPEAVELSYPILDPTSRVLGDAIVILGTALAHWERELAALR